MTAYPNWNTYQDSHAAYYDPEVAALRERNDRKANAIAEWEVNKRLPVAGMSDHNVPMKEHTVTNLPEFIELNAEAPAWRTFASTSLSYFEIGETLKAMKGWKKIKEAQLKDPFTGNVSRFVLIESPSKQRFAVTFGKVKFAEGRKESWSPICYMLDGKQLRKINLESGKLGWTRRHFRDLFKKAGPDSPYCGYRAPHRFALIALLLDGQKLNLVGKHDPEHVARKIAQHSK